MFAENKIGEGHVDANRLVEGARAQWVALLPAKNSRRLARRRSTQTFLAVSDPETGAILTLIQGSDELYRHYENQKHYFANVLMALSAGLSAAPFLLEFSAMFTGALVALSAVVIYALAHFGRQFLVHLRHRMKMMQFRSEMLRAKVFGKEPDFFYVWEGEGREPKKIQVDYEKVSVEQLIELADKRARLVIENEELEDRNASIFSRYVTLMKKRGAIWGFLPRTAKLYAIIFFVIGIAMMINPDIVFVHGRNALIK